jgi:hypothetical protein
MFGARDVWFVVGLPVWHFMQVAGFLAAWTIAYGGIQAIAPAMVRRSTDGLSQEIPAAHIWAAILAAVPIVLAIAMQLLAVPRPDLMLMTGLVLFGLPFTVNHFVVNDEYLFPNNDSAPIGLIDKMVFLRERGSVYDF